MGLLTKSRKELAELGIETTYVIAGRKSGGVFVLDSNPRLFEHSCLPKPDKLPLSGRIYSNYQEAFDAIVQELS